MLDDLITELENKLRNLSHGSRYILGIVGIPGAGKSTLAERLVTGINARFSTSPGTTPCTLPSSSTTSGPISASNSSALAEAPAIVVPMDGFHLSNEKLEQLNLLYLKGIPDSFDAPAFVELLKSLRSNTSTTVYAPLFDRSIEGSVQKGIRIEPAHKLCVVEGNYLLLPDAPWLEGKQYFDQTWFLDVSIETVYSRLLARHMLVKSESKAREKIESTDLPNARLILDTAPLADRLVKSD
jgi:pantothenate kinase